MTDNNTRGTSRILDQVHATPEKLIEAVAMHHAIINTGQEDILDDKSMYDIHHAWQQNLERHCDGMSESAAMKCCDGERKHFMKDAKRQVAAVVKANQPLTIRAADAFWLVKK